MSEDTSRGFWVTNHLVNPILRPLLRSRIGRHFGRRLGVLRYRGRRTGQQRDLVVQCARDGGKAWVMPGQADNKTWWHNLRQPSEVELRLAGEDLHGRAVALDGRAVPDEVRRGLANYLEQLPRARNTLGRSRIIQRKRQSPQP